MWRWNEMKTKLKRKPAPQKEPNTSELKIEKGIPVPTGIRGSRVYPFKDMDVGDSFLVPVDEGGKRSIQSSIAQCSRRYRKVGKQFTTRFLKKEGGIRVWRIK
jgi:hypothetical protein